MFIEPKQMPLMGGPSPFEFKNDDGNLAVDWQNWVRGFEIFIRANAIKKNTVKRDWLLHYVGPKVQNIYFNLPTPSEEQDGQRKGPLAGAYVAFKKNAYTEAITKLNSYFAPKQNTSYERHIYRKLKQEKDERIDSFVMRLRVQANRCDFGDKLDENIKDQMTSGCQSDALRRKFLERGDEDLDSILKVARIFEMVAAQQKEFGISPPAAKDSSNDESSNIYKISNFKPKSRQDFGRTSGFDQKLECGRCGFSGHRASDPKCPAKGKECKKCGKTDHFARKCRTRARQQPESATEEHEPKAKTKRENQVVQMVDQSTKHDDFEDVFCDMSTDAN